MGEKRWNDNFSIGYAEKRRRDPLYQFTTDLFYTQEVRNGIMAAIDSQPLKADKYGVFHGISL